MFLKSITFVWFRILQWAGLRRITFDFKFWCASVVFFTCDMIKLSLAGWGTKTGPGRSRPTVLGLRLCCGGDLNNTISHFINNPPPPPLWGLGAYSYRSNWMKFCFSKWAAYSKAMLISDVEIGKVSTAKCICCLPPDKHAILILGLNRSYFMYLIWKIWILCSDARQGGVRWGGGLGCKWKLIMTEAGGGFPPHHCRNLFNQQMFICEDVWELLPTNDSVVFANRGFNNFCRLNH